MAGRIVVGTSSWADPGFVKEWYPQGMPAGRRLPWYAERFEVVELNASFYAVPERETVRRWVDVTPDEFVFDVKLHRLLSRHSAGLDSLPPGLRDDAKTTPRGRVVLEPRLERALTEELLRAIEPLEQAGKLGALLLQCTPGFEPRRNRLEELEPLVGAFAPRRLALELRHRGWVEGERLAQTLAWCSENGVAFVCVDAPQDDRPGAAGGSGGASPPLLTHHFSTMPPVDAVTCDDLAYFRLHGRDTKGYTTGKSVAERFGWVYGDEELEEVATRVRTLAEEAGEVHVLFNNNRDDDAPSAARRFRALLGQDPGPPPDDGQLRLS
jgi:uncharacterized protein YecE (DUF72 family)